MNHLAFYLLSGAILWVQAGGAGLDEAPPSAARWEPEIAKFEVAEASNPSPKEGIVFYGSSTIVRWDLDRHFPGLVTINRGFGGSQMADARYFAKRVVVPLKPRVLVVYSGDNDLAAGKNPEDIAREFRTLVQIIHQHLPKTQIICLGVKPSLARAHLLEKQRETNRWLQQICEGDPRLIYVDTESLMLREDGSVRSDLLAKDGLHLSEEGYRVWSRVLRAELAKLR